MTTIPLTPAFLFASAFALVGTHDGDAASASLRAPFAAAMDLAATGRWDTAFVHYAGYWSHYDARSRTSSWPFPPADDCDELAAAADLHGVLSKDAPQPGELLLLWSPARRCFVRTGIILSVEPASLDDTGGWNGDVRYACHTIEGAITDSGRPGGNGLGTVWRTLCPDRGDRSIRWMDCLPSARFAAVAAAPDNPALVIQAQGDAARRAA